MSGKLTNAGEVAALEGLFNTAAAFISLHTANPGEGGFQHELDATINKGYARQLMMFELPTTNAEGVTSQVNSTVPSFYCSEGAWSTVTWVGFHVLGEEVSYGELTAPLQINATEEIQFPLGSIEHTLD